MNKLYKLFVVALVGLLVNFNVAGIVLAGQNEIIQEVRDILQDYYVDNLPADTYFAGSVQELMNSIEDPYTNYWTKTEYEEFMGEMEPHFAGIGIYIEAHTEGILVVSPIKDSPAYEAGLKSGDVVVEVDGIVLKGKPVEEIQSLIKGPVGTTVKLKVLRDGQVKDYQIVREDITIPTVTGELVQGNIGYIDINSFAQNTYPEFDELVKEMDEKADSWIIDLRNNTGGYLNTARILAGYFIANSPILQVKERNGFSTYTALDPGYYINEPVVLLVNKYSASASEVLAGALKDYHKAVLVGETTYGKGSIQQIFSLSNGDHLKVTIARFYSPLYHEINGIGIEPDLTVKGIDTKKAAELLLADIGNEATAVDVSVNGYRFKLDYDLLTSDDYWEAWKAMGDSSQLKVLNAFLSNEVNEWEWFYPGYESIGTLKEVDGKARFYLHMPEVNSYESMELINTVSGERVPLQVKHLVDYGWQVIPVYELAKGQEYWLVINGLDYSESFDRVISVIKVKP